MNTGMTLIFICSYKINKSDSKQEFKRIQIGLNLFRVEFRGLYTEFQNHISTPIWLDGMFHMFLISTGLSPEQHAKTSYDCSADNFILFTSHIYAGPQVLKQKFNI
jgi:hypothetical protein